MKFLWGALLLGCSAGPSTPPPRTAELHALRAVAHLPADVSNAFADDPRAAALGQQLFFDPGFSGALLDGDNDGSPNATGRRGDTGRVSCASCHVPHDGFSDTRSIRRQISLGAGWGLRRAPSLLDVAQSKLLMWDGSKDTLQGQVFGPLESEVEMNSSRLYVAQQVAARYRPAYEAIFGPLPVLTATPLTAAQTGCAHLNKDSRCSGVRRGVPGDGADFDRLSVAEQTAVTRVVVNVGKAIAAYERKLRCQESRFDAWLDGDDQALNATELRGAQLFVGEGQCVSCHRGPFMSDEAFHNLGLRPALVATVFIDANDRGAALGLSQRAADVVRIESAFSDGDDGRAQVPLTASLEGAFRTPRLRCVSQRPSFMHTAQLLTLEQVVDFHVRGGDPSGYPGTNELQPLGLTQEDRAALVAFLKALDGPGADASLRASP